MLFAQIERQSPCSITHTFYLGVGSCFRSCALGLSWVPHRDENGSKITRRFAETQRLKSLVANLV